MKNRMLGILAILAVVAALVLAAVTAPANASTTTSGDNTTIKVVEKSAVHTGAHFHGTLVEWLSIHFTAKQKHRLKKPSNCITTDGWNYYGTTAGQGRHWDHNMRLCRSKKSFTGWVKVGGGDSGSHCMNPATPENVPPAPHVPVIPGPITEVKSFAHFFMKLHANEGIKLHIVTDCGPAHIDTKVWAKGAIKAKGLLGVFLKSNGTLHSFSSKLKTALVISAKSSSKVVVIITCHGGSTPPPPPPPAQHTVNIGCTGFEEITGGSSMIVKCDVSTDDQSAKIALSAHANDGNSRVSGINCYSQGGKPSCTGDGTFEFTVTGINDGTSVLSSSVTATASANGVSDTFTSDPYPVDPSSGGF